MAPLQLKLLGGFAVSLSTGRSVDISGRKNQALLAYLALQSGKKLPREKLLALLWSDRGEAQSRGSLRQALAALRHDFEEIEPAVLVFEGDSVGVEPAAIATDVAGFERLAGSDSVADLKEAARLYEGELLDGIAIRDSAFEEWLDAERGRLRETAISGLTRLLERQTGLEAIATGHHLLALDPLREASHRALMRAYAAQGRRDQALRQYRVCRDMLRKELQVEPSKETEALRREIEAGGGQAEKTQPHETAGTEHRPALPLPDRPSIAVLPFENLSGDPAQDYFADGVSENIIAGLSRFRDLFVIARHSSFVYKGKAAKIPDICRELGVRYVLEGSIQRSGNRLRVTAQLIDGVTGRHLWAERYDRRAEDVFAVQDEVTETIVATLATSYGGRLRKAWATRTETPATKSLLAIDYFQMGQDHLNRFTREDNQRALEFFTKAAELDQSYAKPCAKVAWAHLVDVLLGWSEDAAASWAKALEAANEAIRRDDDEAWGHWALGGYYLNCLKQPDRAVAELRKAVELNPNDADCMTDLGWCLNHAGRTDEGLQWALKAMRLNPHFPDWYTMQLGQIYFDARRYGEAIATFHRLAAVDSVPIELWLAASHAYLGQIEEARKARDRALELDPQATISQWTAAERMPYQEQSYLEHLRAGLRKAGLPE